MLKFLFILMISLTSQFSFAGYPCRSGLGGGCPSTPSHDQQLPGGSRPGNGYSGPHSDSDTFIGYVEYPAPKCDPKDYEKALKLAKQDALERARAQFGTNSVREIAARSIYKRCGSGNTTSTSKGIYWIVTIHIDYVVE